MTLGWDSWEYVGFSMLKGLEFGEVDNFIVCLSGRITVTGV